jgi:uncharacterized protein (DUF1330 family)
VKSASPEVMRVVHLFLHPDRRDAFERFESSAAAIMKRYGGRIERRLSLPRSQDTAQPDEIHIVIFPNEAAFEGYRRDPDLVALASLRASAIRETIVWAGVEAPPFADADG